MMKQSKNKKGRLAKSTLSVVLAASMVMTSSSFVWASPVQEIPVETSTYGLEELVGTSAQKSWKDDLVVAEADYNSTIKSDASFSWKISKDSQDKVLQEDSNTLATGSLDASAIGGVVTCTVNGKDNSGSDATPVEVTFNITAYELTARDLAIGDIAAQDYTGNKIEPAVEFSANTQNLTQEDYLVEYGPNTDAGTNAGKVTVSLTDAGESKGYLLPENPSESNARILTKEFTINKANLAGYTAELNISGLSYNADVKTPITGDLTVVNADGSSLVIPDGEYDVVYNPEEVKKAGKYTVQSITAKSTSTNFEGTVIIKGNTFDVAEKSGSSFKLADTSKMEVSYTGEPVRPVLDEGSVVDADGKVVAQTDYEVIYPSDSTSMGEKKAEIVSTGKNYALGTKGEFTYTITAASDIQVSLANHSYPFAGKEIEPEVIIKDKDGNVIDAAKGTDFNVTYSDNKNVTTESKKAKATITFGGSLTGNKSVTREFDIAPLTVEVSKVDIKAAKNQEFTYDGKAKAPVITSISYNFTTGAVQLTEGVDYEVAESDETDVGSYSVDITGKGNYAGKLGAIPYDIVKSRFNTSTVDAVANPLAYGASTPTFKVTNKVSGVEVSEDDYQVRYLNEKGEETTSYPTDMGSYKAVLTYSGSNYVKGDKITVDYKISSATLENALVVLSTEKFTYNPSASVEGQVPTVDLVKIGGKKLDEAVKDGSQNDYKVEYPEKKDCKNAGTYTIKIIGLNTYAGQSKEVTFKIEPMDINTIEGIDRLDVVAGTTHAGTAAAPYANITDRDYTLVAGTDYDMSNDVASKTVTITGKGNYTTSKAISKKYEVADYMLLADPSIKAEVSGTYAYDGTSKEPKIDDIVLTEVYEGGTFTLRKGVDYEATVTRYENNVKAGKASIILTGKGSYKGEKAVEFEITGIDIASEHKIDTTKLDKLSLTYSAGTDHAGTIKNAVGVVNTKTLATLANSNYKVKLYQDGKEVTKAVNPGTYTVSIEGDGNYTGSLTYDITIAGISLESIANIPSKLDDQPYTGKEVTPEVTLAAKNTATKLVKDTDYTVSYLNNIEVGTAYAVVKGAGIYGGTYLVPFNITGTDISEATVTVDGTYTYTGEAVTPKVTVKVGDTVIDPANYDVVATDNTNAGTAKFTVTGKGNCTGTTKEATFEIGKADQKLAVSKTIADALKVRNTNANTYTLKVTGADTELTYKSSNTKIAAVNSAGKISFKHVCGKATITVTAAADDNHNAATLKVAVAVKPATPKITITARAKGFNAKATAVKDITGYQVGYSTDKNFAASKTTKKLVGTTKALNKNFSGLSAKKGYYVRVRAYKKVGTTVYWGNWTSAKKITTK